MTEEIVETPDATPDEPTAPEPDPLAEERARIAEREKELQRGFDEIARREREIQAPPAPEPEDDDFDPEAMKVLERALAKTPYARAVQELYVDMAETELQRFAESKGLDADKLRDTIATTGLLAGGAPSLSGVQNALKKAEKVMRADTFDPDAEREKLKAEVLAELKEEGVRIEDVRPQRTEPGAGKADFFDEDLTPDERYRIAVEEAKRRG